MLKYYKRGALVPFVIVVIIGLTLALLYNGSSYKSEWFSNDGFIETIVFICFSSLILSAVSSTIFFNRIDWVATNKVFSLVSWALLPFGLISYVLWEEISSWMKYPYESNTTLELFIIFVGLTHAIALAVSYIQFRNSYKILK